MHQPYKRLQRLKYKDGFFLQFLNTAYPVLAYLSQEYGTNLSLSVVETFDRLYNDNERVQAQLKRTINNSWHSAVAYPLGTMQRCALPLLYKFINVAVELFIDEHRPENLPVVNGRYKDNKEIQTITALLDMLYQVEYRGPVAYLPVFSIVDNWVRFNERVTSQPEYKSQFWIMRSTRFPALADSYMQFLDTYTFSETPDRVLIETSLACYYRNRYCANKEKKGIGTRIIQLFT